MRVVITGIGFFTSAGSVPADLLMSATAEVRGKPQVLAGGIPGYRIDEKHAARFVPRKHLRKMDRLSIMTTAAISNALSDACIEVPNDNVGLVLDTGFGSAGSVSLVLEGIFGDEPKVSPLLFPNVVANAAAGQAAIAFGLRGPSSMLGGLGSLLYAFDLIRSGKATQLVVGGCDEITKIYARSLVEQGILSDAFFVGEGTAVFVLESDAFAKTRNARIYAEVQSVEMELDFGYRPEGESAYAGSGIDTVIDRSVGTDTIDVFIGAGLEHQSLQKLERQYSSKLGVRKAIWPKSWTGEMFACSSALNIILGSIILHTHDTYHRVLSISYDITRGQSMAAVLKRYD